MKIRRPGGGASCDGLAADTNDGKERGNAQCLPARYRPSADSTGNAMRWSARSLASAGVARGITPIAARGIMTAPGTAPQLSLTCGRKKV
jgi:hypothetical protein